MIVRLMLEFLRRKLGFEMCPQEGHAVELVGIQTQPHPNQMQMIRHKAIRRAEQPLACGGVQHQFAERGVKPFVQPALSPVRDSKRPVDHGVALKVFARKARKKESAVEVWFIHGDAASYEESASESRTNDFVAADVSELLTENPKSESKKVSWPHLRAGVVNPGSEFLR